LPAVVDAENLIPFKCVGRVKDAQGLKGEIYVRLFAGQADWLERLQKEALVYLSAPAASLAEMDVITGPPQVWQMENARRHKEGLVLKLATLSDRTAAEGLKGMQFLIPQNFLESQPGEAVFLSELLSFEVVDVTLGVVGVIAAFSSNGPQDLLVVKDSTGREHLIPLVKPFIEKMDFANKKIFMNLPPGLLE
jgi:16S rRNA processing protein RimM